MPEQTTNNISANKRIAKNTIFMSIRMIVVLGITLYTTRVVLRVLGVEDYGIYNVVCGFVSMFSFLNTSMSNGIQRFFNYEYGKNGTKGANVVYTNAILIQFFISIVIIILAETIGLWYLNCKMVIPDTRLVAANWIFQFAIVGFVFTIMQAPFSAAVMAHERMNFFATIGIIDVFLKLAIVFALPFIDADSLIYYGLLLAILSSLIFISYYAYTKRNFEEINFHWKWSKEFFMSMLGFSGWNVFGTFGGIIKEQGLNLIINFFFGPVVNAARGVAAQVINGLQSFANNVIIPVRPQVTQSYAVGDLNRMMALTYSVSKISSYILYLVALPVIINIDFILRIWLGTNVPEHTSAFVIIVILNTFVNNLNSSISGIVHSTGKMRVYQLSGCIINLMSLPLSYIVLFCGYAPEYALVVNLVISVIGQYVALVVAKRLVYFKLSEYATLVLLPLFRVVFFSAPIPFFIAHYTINESICFFATLLTSSLLTCVCIYLTGLNQGEKSMLNGYIDKFKKESKKDSSPSN